MRQPLLALLRWALVGGCLAGGCGDSDEPPIETTTYLDDASDEAFAAFQAEVAGGHTVIDDAKAATLTSPTNGQRVSTASPVRISWTGAVGKPALVPHGVETGTFVWIRLSGGGTLAGGVKLVALSSTAWTPDADTWARMIDAGTVEVAIHTATMDDGTVTEGPFQPTTSTSFSIAP